MILRYIVLYHKWNCFWNTEQDFWILEASFYAMKTNCILLNKILAHKHRSHPHYYNRYATLKLQLSSHERTPRDWVKLCRLVKLPYCQYKNNHKIFHGNISFMPYRRVCLISGCALVKLHCTFILINFMHC